jgi:hypothetical protein
MAVSQADGTQSSCATVTPVFSQASLNGRYVFRVIDTDLLSNFQAGAFTADGKGSLTTGIEDVNIPFGGGPITNLAFSGTYDIGPDERGTLTISTASATSQFTFVLASSTRGQIIEFDSTAATFGVLLSQDQSAISNLAGAFVFGFQGEFPITISSLGWHPSATSSVGQMIFDGSGGVSGLEDVNAVQLLPIGFGNAASFSGTYTLGPGGRGTATLARQLGTSHYVFYIVNAETIEFVDVDQPNVTQGAMLVDSGEAVAQQNISFDNSSLGSTAFWLNGMGCPDAGKIPAGGGCVTRTVGVAIAGRFDTDGAGTILKGVLDNNSNGVFLDDVPLNGSYSIAANGRGTITVNPPSGSSSNYVFWLASPSYAEFLDTNAAAMGVAQAQQAGAFSSSSLNGNFGFSLVGTSNVIGPLYFDFASVGQMVFDGNGGLTGNENANHRKAPQSPMCP